MLSSYSSDRILKVTKKSVSWMVYVFVVTAGTGMRFHDFLKNAFLSMAAVTVNFLKGTNAAPESVGQVNSHLGAAVNLSSLTGPLVTAWRLSSLMR